MRLRPHGRPAQAPAFADGGSGADTVASPVPQPVRRTHAVPRAVGREPAVRPYRPRHDRHQPAEPGRRPRSRSRGGAAAPFKGPHPRTATADPYSGATAQGCASRAGPPPGSVHDPGGVPPPGSPAPFRTTAGRHLRPQQPVRVVAPGARAAIREESLRHVLPLRPSRSRRRPGRRTGAEPTPRRPRAGGRRLPGRPLPGHDHRSERARRQARQPDTRTDLEQHAHRRDRDRLGRGPRSGRACRIRRQRGRAQGHGAESTAASESP